MDQGKGRSVLKIPKIVWFGAAAAVLGYVIYRAVKGTDFLGGGLEDQPPAVDRGLTVTWVGDLWVVVDVEKTWVVVRMSRAAAVGRRVAISGEFYVIYRNGLEERRWPRVARPEGIQPPTYM